MLLGLLHSVPYPCVVLQGELVGDDIESAHSYFWMNPHVHDICLTAAIGPEPESILPGAPLWYEAGLGGYLASEHLCLRCHACDAFLRPASTLSGNVLRCL